MRITTLSAYEGIVIFKTLEISSGGKTYGNGGEDIVVMRLFAVDEALENSKDDNQKGSNSNRKSLTQD